MLGNKDCVGSEMILKLIEWKELQLHFLPVNLPILILHNIIMGKLFWNWLVNQPMPELIVTVYFPQLQFMKKCLFVVSVL